VAGGGHPPRRRIGSCATLRAQPGSLGFNLLGLLVAGIWCTGALAVGPPRLWTSPPSIVRTVVVALVIGGATFLFFLAADLIGRHLPLVAPALHSLLAKADAENKGFTLAVALLNAVGEELFFRGVLYDTLPRSRVGWSVAIYVTVTAATGNAALVVAALVMGIILGVERRSSRGVLAPMLTHLSWSTLVLLYLPR
jgi:membrane protease YdiL (CAAX protease family)